MTVDEIVSDLYPRGTVERPSTKTSAYMRLWQLIYEDKKDLCLIIVYTFFSGLFSLSIPLATQTLVNTIAAGVFLQPLWVIAGAVFAGLLFVAFLRLLTFWTVEKIRQRTFARTSLRLAYRVPRVKHSALSQEYLPELVNRFFDTITVQSGWFNFLLDAPAAALQVIVGLAILALYSPWLLLFDLIVIAFFLFEVLVLGHGGFRTRSDETTQRFLIAEWLEELARCETGIKTNGNPAHLVEHVDNLLVEYVKRRRTHFGVLFRQATGLFFFQAVCSTLVLGVGGYLVIERQLSMGQLVASLLIVNLVLPALERLVRNLQNVYELLSALNKIGYVEDLPLERKGGIQLPRSTNGLRIDIKGLQFSYPNGTSVLKGLDLSLNAGERLSLFGPNGSGKTTLTSVLCGLVDPSSGLVQLNGVDVRDIDLDSLRSAVALASDADEIFPATVIENITLGRTDISHMDVLWALHLVEFGHELQSLANGLKTNLTTGGTNLSRGQRQKLLIARAICKRPQLLLLDEAFTAIEEKTKIEILNRIYSADLNWTVIDISHDADSINHSNKIVVMSNGVVIESGEPSELIRKKNSQLQLLFPQLVTMLRAALERQDGEPR